MRLILTRPQDELAKLVEQLSIIGHTCIESPLLSIRMRPDAVIPRRAYQALVLSSANAMRHPSLNPGPAILTAIKVFAVGAQSAEAARQAGYEHVNAEGGNVEGLARAIARDCDPKSGPILYPSGADIAGDLKGTLEAHGFKVECVILYDAVAAKTLTAQTVAALKSGAADGVLLYSPRSARIWVSLVAESGLTDTTRRIRHFCLSPNVAAALGPGFITAVAARPDEPSLLALLDRAI
ncbi:MAG: uroporphyrinogen-III synthase [Hyphomicrobiales bacterium]